MNPQRGLVQAGERHEEWFAVTDEEAAIARGLEPSEAPEAKKDEVNNAL